MKHVQPDQPGVQIAVVFEAGSRCHSSADVLHRHQTRGSASLVFHSVQFHATATLDEFISDSFRVNNDEIRRVASSDSGTRRSRAWGNRITRIVACDTARTEVLEPVGRLP
jgi:hypothetical protein